MGKAGLTWWNVDIFMRPGCLGLTLSTEGMFTQPWVWFISPKEDIENRSNVWCPKSFCISLLPIEGVQVDKLRWKCLDWDEIKLIANDQVPPTPWLTWAVSLRQLEGTADLLRSLQPHAFESLRVVPAEEPSTFHSRFASQFTLIKIHSLGAAFEEKQTASIQSFSYQMPGYPADKRTLSLLFQDTSSKPGEMITSRPLGVVPASKSLCRPGGFLLVVSKGGFEPWPSRKRPITIPTYPSMLYKVYSF